jgi:hypothetical protein
MHALREDRSALKASSLDLQSEKHKNNKFSQLGENEEIFFASMSLPSFGIINLFFFLQQQRKKY